MKTLKYAALFILLSLVPGCGQQLVEFGADGGNLDAAIIDAGAADTGTVVDGGDVTAPFVTFTIPVSGASIVPVDSTIIATFNEAIDPATIDGTSFTVTQGVTTIAGALTYTAATYVVTFTPAAPLSTGVSYVATITTGIKDLAGNRMAANYVWSFATLDTLDIIPPKVSSTNPVDLDVDLPVNKVISATFSEQMDPSTIVAATFTLMDGPTAIPGAVAYDAVNNIATFTPTNTLSMGTTYTALITTGARDLAGNALAGDIVPNPWAFTTKAAPVIRPTVTSVTPANATPSVAINAKLTATFSEAMDAATITAAGTFTVKGPFITPVPGTVAYDGPSKTATFTPTANLQNDTTFVAVISIGAESLAGGTAMANPFEWTFSTSQAADVTAPVVSFTSPANLDASVATNRKIVATFDEAMDPATIIAANVTVTGPAGAVAGAVTYAANSFAATFAPTVLFATSSTYTVTIKGVTGVKDLAGNPMAANYVWSFTTAAAPDIIGPKVSSTNPIDLAVGVPINKKISATFSEPMDPLTITTTHFTVMDGLNPVVGTILYDAVNNIATFTPLNPLAVGRTYIAQFSNAVEDLAGNALVAGLVPNPWTFTTVAALLPPTVTSTVPLNGDTGVQINRRITATFSEVMDATTISTASFKLTGPLGVVVIGVVTYAGQTAVFTPTGALDPNSLYTATITTIAKNPLGLALAANYPWSFNTGPANDTTAPKIIATGAFDGETGLPVNRNSTVTFSEPMNPTTLVSPAITFTVKEFVLGTTVAGVVTYIGNTATFNPNVDLKPSTKYTSTVSTGAEDLSGNALVAGLLPNPWSWTTGAAPDLIAPTVTVTNPDDLEINVPIDKKINATFSKAMDPMTITNVTFTVMDGLIPVNGTVAYDVQNNIATFSPLTNLTPDTSYAAMITSGAESLSGIALVVPAVLGLPTPNPWSFKTAPATVPVEPLAINLRGAASFGIASRAGLTSTGITVVNGDVALYPLAVCTDSTGNAGASQTCLVKTYVSPTGMTVNGSIYWAGDPFDNGGTANSVTNDLNIAWTEGKNKADTRGAIAASEMGGKTFLPGVYHNAVLGLAAGGIATIDAQNDANAIFIFKVDSSFVDSGTLLLKSRIDLKNGAQARNVWFVTGLDITIGSGTTWNGNILAGRTATILDGSTVNGRVLGGASGAGAITLTGAAAPSVTTITVPQ